MTVAVGIHHPKGPKEEVLVLEDMKRFGEEQRRYKGLVLVTTVKDETDGCLVGIAIWDTRENFLAERKEIAKTYTHSVDFDVVEDREVQFLYGEPAFWG
jgi:hypothetical protein